MLSLCPHYKEQIPKLLYIQKTSTLPCKKPIFSNGQMFNLPFNSVVFKGWFKQWALQSWEPRNTMYFLSSYQLVITRSCSYLLERLHMTSSLPEGERAGEQGREGSFACKTWKLNLYTQKISWWTPLKSSGTADGLGLLFRIRGYDSSLGFFG